MRHKILLKLYTALCLLSALLAVGCEKSWLEAKVDQKQAIPSTIEDFRAMLNNPDISYGSSPVLLEVAADYHLYSQPSWDGIKNSYFGNAYTWSLNANYKAVGDWNQSYTAIFYLNIVLEGLTKIQNSKNGNEARRLIGEALFYRSKTFFELSQIFSPPYSPEGLNQATGLPLRVDSDAEIPTERSTLKKTYERIITDIHYSMDLLPDNVENITKPNKLAAIGLLARIYLSMEFYDSAHHYSSLYLQQKNSLLDYNSISPTVDFIGINTEVNNAGFLLPYSQILNYTIDPELFEQYENNDLRKSIFFTESGGLVVFKGSYSLSPYDFFAAVATDEIYLIQAECLARKNKTTEAMKYLNNLVRSRYLKENGLTTYTDQTADNQTDALHIILKEREKQLILRNVRWSDLRRLNKDPRFAKTITRTIDGEKFVLSPNSYKYTLPIPNDVISKTGIKQNEGWE